MNRIRPIDGLRAFAVFGVLWSHIWMFYQNIPLTIYGININSILGSGFIGVDLFFVISGFCMYLMYAKKADTTFNLNTYGQFLSKRWKRIAPSFYFVVLFECVFHLFKSGVFPFRSLAYHYTFLNIFDDQNVLSPPFWSLDTEWHFYLILPFIFFRDKERKWTILRISLLMLASMIIRITYFAGFNLSEGKTIPTDPVWFRFIEFAWGMLAALFYIKNRVLLNFLRGNIGVILCLFLVCIGRGLMITPVYNYFGDYAFIVRPFGEPIMTFGFALLVLNVITSESLVSKLLQTRPILFAGKVSYSMYLWHWIISIHISFLVMNYTGVNSLGMLLSFLFSVLALIPVSYLSYRYFELPYFKVRHATVPLTENISPK